MVESIYTSSYFESRFHRDPKRDIVWGAICKYLQQFISINATVLDLGAGYCSFINNICAKQKYALDIFPGFVQFANSDVKTHIGSCANLSMFASQYFDVVFTSNLLEHLKREHIFDTLSEAHRVLRRSGHFIIIQPNFKFCYRDYFDDYTHLQIFTHVSLTDLLTSKGFIIERLEPRFIPFSFKSAFPKWAWLAKIYLRLPVRPFAKQMLVVSRPDKGKEINNV